MNLRDKLIRLAHENPNLRADLLPLLVETSVTAAQDKTASGRSYYSLLNSILEPYHSEVVRGVETLLKKKTIFGDHRGRPGTDFFNGGVASGTQYSVELLTNGELGTARAYIIRWSNGKKSGSEIAKWIEFSADDMAEYVVNTLLHS